MLLLLTRFLTQLFHPNSYKVKKIEYLETNIFGPITKYLAIQNELIAFLFMHVNHENKIFYYSNPFELT